MPRDTSVPFRVIVTGGRDFGLRKSERELIETTLMELYLQNGDLLIVHGDAKGTDTVAKEWGKREGLQVEAHKARWHDMSAPGAYRVPGTAHNANAGKDRNQKMADAGADLCLAFPGGNGTADMVRRASRAGIRVVMMSMPKVDS